MTEVIQLPPPAEQAVAQEAIADGWQIDLPVPQSTGQERQG